MVKSHKVACLFRLALKMWGWKGGSALGSGTQYKLWPGDAHSALREKKKKKTGREVVCFQGGGF